MKTTVVLAALAASFAGMTSAQSLSDIPACVLTCTTQAASSAGCSGITGESRVALLADWKGD